MKTFFAAFILLTFTLFTQLAFSFVSWGPTNYQYLEYRDLARDGDGYVITLVNKHHLGLEEFYVIIQGIDISGNVLYRQPFYVDFIPGNGQITYFMPGYHDRIF